MRTLYLMAKKEKFVNNVKESKMGNIYDAARDVDRMIKGVSQIALNEIQELEARINWLEKGLKEITEQEGSSHNEFENLKQIAQSYLDGEPTTADEFNE